MATYTYLCLVCLQPFDAASPNRKLPAHEDVRSLERRLCNGQFGWLIEEHAPVALSPSLTPAAHRPGFGPWPGPREVVLTGLRLQG